jgi:hypothetical protein
MDAMSPSGGCGDAQDTGVAVRTSRGESSWSKQASDVVSGAPPLARIALEHDRPGGSSTHTAVAVSPVLSPGLDASPVEPPGQLVGRNAERRARPAEPDGRQVGPGDKPTGRLLADTKAAGGLTHGQ